MTSGVKQFIAGGTLLLVSGFFLPRGIADFAAAPAERGPAPSGAAVYVGIGSVLVIAAVALLVWALLLRSKHRNTVRTYDTREAEDTTHSRAGYGMQDRPTWMDRPVNHMGDNYGDRRK